MAKTVSGWKIPDWLLAFEAEAAKAPAFTPDPPWASVSILNATPPTSKEPEIKKPSTETPAQTIARRAIDAAIKVTERANNGGNFEDCRLAFSAIYEMVLPFLTHDDNVAWARLSREWDEEAARASRKAVEGGMEKIAMSDADVW